VQSSMALPPSEASINDHSAAPTCCLSSQGQKTKSGDTTIDYHTAVLDRFMKRLKIDIMISVDGGFGVVSLLLPLPSPSL
ncbi:hypothetical protein PMAYCL1PPCAC_11822, partial [Pristionchus mayeri]